MKSSESSSYLIVSIGDWNSTPEIILFIIPPLLISSYPLGIWYDDKWWMINFELKCEEIPLSKLSAWSCLQPFIYHVSCIIDHHNKWIGVWGCGWRLKNINKAMMVFFFYMSLQVRDFDVQNTKKAMTIGNPWSCWTWFSIPRSCRSLRPWNKFRMT